MSLDKEFFVTFAFTILNIVILYIILRKILFKPVTKYMDNRTKKIQDALNAAEESKKMVEQMKIEYDEKVKAAKDEGQKVVEMYRQMAEKEYNSIINAAKEEANQMMENTKAELQVEKEQLVTSIKEEISDLVLATSEKVLKENVDTAKNRKLITEFVENRKIS